MARDDAIKVEGAVVEILPNNVFRVELSNGHRLNAYVTGKARHQACVLAIGDRVNLELSPYDLSEGRIVSEPKIV